MREIKVLSECCKAEIKKIQDVVPTCSFCGGRTDENGAEWDKMDSHKIWRTGTLEYKRIADLDDNHLLNILKWIDKQTNAVDYGGEDHIYVYEDKEDIRRLYNYWFIERQCTLRGLIKEKTNE